MKKLAVLIVLLLALAPFGQALTFTDADIQYPTFSWGDYVFRLSLYTDVPEEINYAPYPAHGTLIKIQITVLYGDVPLQEILDGINEFNLHVSPTVFYAPIDLRKHGVSVYDNTVSLTEKQSEFELIFLLPEGVSAGATELWLGDPLASEHVFVRLPDDPNGSDTQATHTPLVEPISDPEIDTTQASDISMLITLPESADIVYDGTTYHVTPIGTGYNEDGQTTVTLSGYGANILIKNNVMILPVEATIEANGQAYDWQNLSIDQGIATFGFDTELSPQVIYLYPHGDKGNRTALAVIGAEAQITPDAAMEPAEELTVAPEGSSVPMVPSTEENIFVNRLLFAAEASVSDPWVIAILDSGAQEVQKGEGVLTFLLRSFNPNLKQLDTTTPDFLERLYQNLSTHDLACTLKVNDAGGNLSASDADVKMLLKNITKVAVASKKAFGNKALSTALMSALADDRLTMASEGEYSPLLATQNKVKLILTDGPHALQLSASFANMDTLLQQGYDAALLSLAKQGGASMLSEEEIGQVLIEELTAQAKISQKKASEKHVFVVDIDQLIASDSPSGGEAYQAFLGQYSEVYYNRYAMLVDIAAAMPDYPALDMPVSGRLSGSKSGTRVIFKTPDDGVARFVQMRGVENEEAVVSLFIKSGKSVTVHVPKGQYYILVAGGTLWYGEQHLFGDEGQYEHTEDLEIMGGNYYHTITLGSAIDGNMSSYGSDPSEFQ